MYPDMQGAFQTPISQGGWLAKPQSQFSPEDQQWLQKRFNASLNQNKVNKLFENYYVKHNRESLQLWQKLYEEKSILFAYCDTTDPYSGVLRLYDNKKLFDFTVDSHKKYGFLKETLSVNEIAKRFPVYKTACNNGLIAGGLIGEGFSINILQFSKNIINYLEQRNVNFFWNTEIAEIEIKNDVIEGLRTTTGQKIICDNYSINPGAYDTNLFANTPVKGKIGGVAGRWLLMPRPEGYDTPTKIHGDKRPGFPVTDNNLTPFTLNGKRMIAVGGGYVYVGSNAKEYNEQAYAMLDSENERTMDLYLGDFYRKAKKNGETFFWKNTCVRSFTYDDKPIHEIMPTSKGGFLTITAGTNTGTATISPFLAKWTSLTMKGIDCPLY